MGMEGRRVSENGHRPLGSELGRAELVSGRDRFERLRRSGQDRGGAARHDGYRQGRVHRPDAHALRLPADACHLYGKQRPAHHLHSPAADLRGPAHDLRLHLGTRRQPQGHRPAALRQRQGRRQDLRPMRLA